MKYEVSREIEFDAGHRVPNHLSKCASPHGHRYRCRVTFSGPLVPDGDRADAGMVVDFTQLKVWLTELVHDRFDHAFIVQASDLAMRSALALVPAAVVVVVPFPPTAEELAAEIFTTLTNRITGQPRCPVTVVRVELWETPTSLATVSA